MQKLVARGRKAQGVLARPCAKPVAGLGKWREREREREREKERKREREKERKRERERESLMGNSVQNGGSWAHSRLLALGWRGAGESGTCGIVSGELNVGGGGGVGSGDWRWKSGDVE